MTLALVFWCALAMVTFVLIVLTVSYLTHDSGTCRTCVDRAARRRLPAWQGPEDRPGWGRL